MTTTRAFHIGDILSVTDGKLISLRHIGGVYDILGWMTGESLMTHQLPRAMDECRPSLVEQHPDLAAVVVPSGLSSMEALEEYLATLYPTYGETRPVQPLAEGEHTHIDPIAELQMMRPDMPVIVVKPE